MPTDPYVPNDIDSDPRQLPNLAPGVHMPPAGSWHADRPGDLVAGQPHGEMLGSPGPDVGYARLLVERRRDHLVISSHESRDDVEAVVAELAMKRAASFGRAPVVSDVDVAMELLGYSGDIPLETPAWRLHLVHEAAHEYAKRRRIIDSVPLEVLRLPPAQVAEAMAGVRAALEAVAHAGLMPPFVLPGEYEEFRAAARRLAETGIEPNARAADADAAFPMASFAAYRESGLGRALYPAELGGDGGDWMTYAILVEEIARVCAASSLFVLISRLGMTPVIRWGSPELQARTVPRVASGECQASYCLSEPQAGSDVAAMSTRAVRDGDDWILTGRKIWITNAGVSDFYTLFAKTDPDSGHRGISAFVVEADRAGFSIGKLEHKMGVRGSPTGEILLDDVRIPGANLIGDEGRGFGYAMTALDSSRPIIGAQAVGIAQGALDASCTYVQERSQFGKHLAEFQGLQFMLADMATQVEAARTLVYRACALVDAGHADVARTAAMAKLFASDTAMRVTTDAVQLLGGAGYTNEFPVERMMRDAKITQIYEGTNQIQRVVIAKHLLS